MRERPVERMGWTILDGESWDRTVSGFDGVCQEQLFAYARKRWPGVGLEPVLFSEQGKPVGGALVMLQRLPLGLATIALVKWGPFLADGQAGDAETVLARMVDALSEEYAGRRAMMVSILPRLEPGKGNRLVDVLETCGFSEGVNVRYPLRYVVDVRPGEEARMAAFSQKWRYNLRKAFKAGLDFEHGGPEDIKRFMTLYRAMSDRKLFADHSGIDTAADLMAMPDGTARPELFFVTRGGETVAGAMIFSAGETACYLYGATNDNALGLRAGYFLHWHVIGWLRDKTKARFYDLGGTDGSAGLLQFKTGMVGEAGYIAPLPPVHNFAIHWRARVFGTLAYQARDRANGLRDRLLALRLDAMRRFKRRAR